MTDFQNNANRSPLFILSCARSGSTLLRCIIDTHPEICSPPELGLGTVCSSLYRASYYSVGQLPNITSEEAREDIVIREVRQVIEHLMGQYTQGKGKKIWCEKTLTNLDHLSVLNKIFPEAKYICLYRNCMDMVSSCIKLNPLGFMSEVSSYIARSPGNFVAAIIEYWLDYTTKMLEYEEANPSHSFRVNYESLASNPALVLPSLFEFAGTEWDSSILDAVFKQAHDTGQGDYKVWLSKNINKDSIGQGVSIPLTSIPNYLIERIDSLHTKLGYPSIQNYYLSAKQNNHSEQESDDDGYVETRCIKQEIAAILARKHDQFSGLQGSCKLVFQGKQGGVWQINLIGQEALIEETTMESNADCTLTITPTTFYSIIDGKKSVTTAYEQGEITASGVIGLAIQFGKLLLA